MPVVEVGHLRAVIDSYKSNSFVGLMMDDVDFDAGVPHVLGKGHPGRGLPSGQATALALGQ